MVAITAGKVSQFIKSPNKDTKAILIYGPDLGLVRENASKLAELFSNKDKDQGEIVTIDELDLNSSPDRLAVEIQMIPMFGGNKVVKFRPGARTNPKILEEFISNSDLPSYLIVEAGDLKKTAKLRQLFEKSKTSAALPCYPDDSRNISTLIEEHIKSEGLSISSDAKQYLINMLGADRALSRMEIEKLALYTKDKKTIDIEDIDMIIGDTAAINLDNITVSIMSGNLSKALINLQKALESGNTSSTILINLNRYINRLLKVRLDLKNGIEMNTSMRKLYPPVHFKIQDVFKKHCQNWSDQKLLKALDLVQQTTLRSRTKNNMEDVFFERLLMTLSQMARK